MRICFWHCATSRPRKLRHRQNGTRLEDIHIAARTLREVHFDLDEKFLALQPRRGWSCRCR